VAEIGRLNAGTTAELGQFLLGYGVS